MQEKNKRNQRVLHSAVCCLVATLFLFSSSIGQISNDAVILTLRIQKGIFLDSALARRVDSSLIAARTVEDSLEWIHAFPDYVPTDLSVRANASWTSAWRRRELVTGEPYIDSLGRVFRLANVALGALDWFYLRFSQPLQARNLAAEYKRHRDIIYAEPNHYGGDGDRIEFFIKNGIEHLAFSHGWGDCLAGCIYRFYWYVTVTRTDSGRVPALEESRFRNGAYIYRWNIPPRYAVTMFPNADSMISTVRNASKWWVRRHAIEGLWRLFVWTYPWVGEDLNSTWNALKNQVMARRIEVLSTLQQARTDPDPDVRASADTAIARITTVGVQLPELPTEFSLSQNYPNPFNPTTKIDFQIPTQAFVSLKVFDLLGREVATLVNEMKSAGAYAVDFNATTLSSGVYYYRFTAGSFTQTKKMILAK